MLDDYKLRQKNAVKKPLLSSLCQISPQCWIHRNDYLYSSFLSSLPSGSATASPLGSTRYTFFASYHLDTSLPWSATNIQCEASLWQDFIILIAEDDRIEDKDKPEGEGVGRERPRRNKVRNINTIIVNWNLGGVASK